MMSIGTNVSLMRYVEVRRHCAACSAYWFEVAFAYAGGVSIQEGIIEMNQYVMVRN
jgi:hypothetical protein